MQHQTVYRELRCQHCGRKLAEAKGSYTLSIRCRRCGRHNQFQAV